MAALAGVRPSAERPVEYCDVNIGGTMSVLELMRRREVPHLVFASSSSIYGINPDVPWTENALPQPISVYASSKLAGESMVAHGAAQHGYTCVGARLFTVYGPGQRPDLAITNFAGRMLSRAPVNVFGDGSALRDFTYVDDIVAGLRAAMDYRECRFETFNLARGDRVKLMDVITTLEETLDVEAKIEYFDPIRGDVPQTWGSIARSSAELGYQPATDLRAGIEASRDWFHIVAETLDFD
jgi:UDP-glucuronate 4-epimerase